MTRQSPSRRQALVGTEDEDAPRTRQDGVRGLNAPRREPDSSERCADCGTALEGQASLDGRHFDGACPCCGTGWAIRYQREDV